MKKRIIAMLLSLSLAIPLVACKDEGKSNTDIGKENVTTESEIEEIVLPDITGGGEDFDIFLAYNSFDYDFIAEEETGDLINDLVKRRNDEVQSRLDVNFKIRPGNTDNGSATATIRSLVQGGDDTYEVFVNVQHYGVPLIYENLFVNWTDSMPHVNLDKPWWYQTVNRDLNFGSSVYVAAGAYNFHCLRAAAAIAFNKTMLDEVGLEYPYGMVLDGTWTIDKMIEYSKAVQKDLNGDGKITYDNDRIGFSGWKWETIPALFVGMGGQQVVKDEYGFPLLNINNERTFSVIDKLIEVFASGNGAWSNGSEYGYEDNMFRDGRLLFNDGTLGALPGNVSMEDDFGVIPYPKLDEEQEDYRSRIVNYSSLTYIPVTNGKLELTSTVLEYMAYLSYRDIIPAFYDTILEVKTARDTESEEMVNIIRETACFMDENYLTSGNLITITESGTNTLASSYASNGAAWESKLDEISLFWYTN